MYQPSPLNYIQGNQYLVQPQVMGYQQEVYPTAFSLSNKPKYSKFNVLP